MKAMILAAGLGQRMRPLTDHTPKPLLQAGGKCLIDYHLDALQRSGIKEVIINLAYLGEQIRSHCGDGSRYGLSITYSQEPEPLETGGAIAHALAQLGYAPFLLINGDVWTDFDLQTFINKVIRDNTLAHLLMVPNPSFHPEGDFGLYANGQINLEKEPTGLTFAGVSIIHPKLIREYPQVRTKFPLGEVFRWAIAQGQISGEIFYGGWSDVGTPTRLMALDQDLTSSNK